VKLASWVGQLLLVVVGLFAFPVLAAVALPFASRSRTTSLPTWLSWLNTYDDPGPSQGMYEAQVKLVYDRFGWYVKTWYWLGWRNQGYTLFWLLAPVLDTTKPLVTVGNHGQAPGWAYDWAGYWERGRVFSAFGRQWTVGWGWKLFSVKRFFTTHLEPGPLDRPLFYLQLRPYKP
jgi:hypothetical protein